jgi:hypothetical protein
VLPIAAAVIALAGTTASGQTIAQGPISNPANGHLYFRLSNSNWTAAEAAAIALGGHLVTINDSDENNFVLNTFTNAPGSGRVWLGFNDAAAEGTFVWVSGEAPAYTNWDGGEPNNAGNEDYAAQYSGNGRWFDAQDVANPFGIGPVYGVVEAPCNPLTIAQGPVFNPANGHYYYRLSNSNWSDAQCFARTVLHGNLVTINDAAENTFILTTFTNAPGSGRVWLGYNDALTEGTFGWVAGDAPSYTNWDPGEPNNSGNEDYAAQYSGNGRWFDAQDVANPFGIGPVYGVVELPSNDACADAFDVSAGGTFAGSLTGMTNNPSDGVGTCGTSSTNPDVWFRFVAPACAGRLTVSTCGTHDAAGVDSGIDTVVSLHAGCGLAQLDCNDDGVNDPCGALDDGNNRDSYLTRELAAGEAVLIRVSKFNTTALGPFRLNVSFGPSNDECTSPRPISIGTTLVCTTGSTNSTPTDENGCAIVPRTLFKDLWYRYVPATNGVFTVDTCNDATNFDTIIAAYASCPAANNTALRCNDDACGASGLLSRIRVTGTAGAAYLIRVAGFDGQSGDAGVTIYCPADFNFSGVVSVQDIFDFLAAYFSNDPRADINGSGAITVQDIFDFLAAYFGGC